MITNNGVLKDKDSKKIGFYASRKWYFVLFVDIFASKCCLFLIK